MRPGRKPRAPCIQTWSHYNRVWSHAHHRRLTVLPPPRFLFPGSARAQAGASTWPSPGTQALPPLLPRARPRPGPAPTAPGLLLAATALCEGPLPARPWGCWPHRPALREHSNTDLVWIKQNLLLPRSIFQHHLITFIIFHAHDPYIWSGLFYLNTSAWNSWLMGLLFPFKLIQLKTREKRTYVRAPKKILAHVQRPVESYSSS